VNTGAPWPDQTMAEQRVLGMQTKLHRWAGRDPRRRFDDLFNLVVDPAFLVVAWNRVRHNRGARTAGVDGIAPRSVGPAAGAMLAALRDDLKARRFIPAPVREKAIPKASGKVRRLGIPTTADRVVQASLKLVLEPIFEADFAPASYGFRPRRRAQDAIAEIFYFASPTRNYEWVLEADIAACFDEIDHRALMGRVCRRVPPRGSRHERSPEVRRPARSSSTWPAMPSSSRCSDERRVRGIGLPGAPGPPRHAPSRGCGRGAARRAR
jgi:RNA-directed DNA polymerase